MGKGGGSGEGAGEGAGDGAGAYKGKPERIAVPAMPYPMSIICCILNFLIPGLGTMIAGFSVFCCSRNEDMEGATRFVSCLTSFGIGLLQLLTTLLFLIGWIWSCVWGVFFIGMSAEYYYNNKVNDHDGRPGLVVHTQPSTMIITTGGGPPTTVITQPHTQVYTTLNQPAGPRFGPSFTQQAVIATQHLHQQNTYGFQQQPGPALGYPAQNFPAPPPYQSNEKQAPQADAAYPPPPPPAYM